jgi:hypothetical protein
MAFGAGPDPSAAIAVGDLNGDGLPDVVYADGYVSDVLSSVGVLLGTPSGLGPARIYPVGHGANWVTLSDVNGDGALDILAVNSDPFYGHSISVLLGNGHGAFVPGTNVDLGVGASVTCVQAGDLNGDGHVDLVASVSNGTFVYVLLGNGDGTFGPPTLFASSNNTHALALADLNGDGHLDVVCGGDEATVLFGIGDGTFADRQFLGVGGGMPVVSDLNHDGIPDIAFTGGSEVTVLLGMGSNKFASPSTFATGFTAAAIAVGDINGDGIPDIATSNDYTSTVSVLLGNGDGSFGKAPVYPVGGYPTCAAAGDLDGDGIPDLAVTNNNSGTVSLFRGRGDGTFTAATAVLAPFPNEVTIQDLNHDGIGDLVVGGTGITVFLGAGGFTFGAARTYDDTLFFNSVAVGDLNGDGIPDLAATYPGKFADIRPWNFIPGTAVYVLFGAGDGTFRAETTYTVGQTPYDVAIVDVNGDGRNDLVVANAGSSTVSVLLADGHGGMGTEVEYPVGVNPNALAVGDFDGDGHLDIAVTSASNNSASIIRGRGDGTFLGPNVIESLGPVNTPQAIAAVDLDRDGHVDLVLSTAYDNGVRVLRGLGDGTFAPDEIYGTGVGPGRVAIRDFNGDGFADLAVPNAYTNTVTILRNINPGTSTPVLASLVAVDASSAAVRLTWWSASIRASQTMVERSGAGGAWLALGHPQDDGPDRMTFEDRTVREGESYTYRLAASVGAGTIELGQTTVQIPFVDALALDVSPNPLTATGLITFHLATRDASQLSIYDVAGRRIWSAQTGDLGPGQHSIALPSRTLPSGAYVIRLTQARRAMTRRLIVVR